MDIRNSISLQDRVTPTLRSILRSMDSMMVVMRNLDRQSNKGTQSKAYKRAEKDIKRANNELIKMSNYTKMAGDSATKAAGSYGKLSTAVSSVGKGMQSIGTSASKLLSDLYHGVELAERVADKVQGIMTSSDTSRSQVARLGLYNTSGYSNEELYGQVFNAAMATRSDLTDTADLVNKILISGVYKGASAVQAAIGTAGIINKALIAGGGTAEENQRALKQLTQGLSSGVLQGDELRSIREQTPYFAQVLAEGLAQVDDKFEGIGIGDLKALGAEGELTADRVIKAMWAMQDEINSDFESMPKTFGQAVTSLSNIWKYFLWLISTTEGPLGKVNQMLWNFVDYLQSPQGLELLHSVAIGINFITTALVGAMEGIGTFITYLQDNAPVAQALFVALGTAAVAAGISSAAAWISACWPILLVAVAVGLVAYQFLQAGYAADEFVGGFLGGVGAVLACIWDGIVWIARVIMWIGTLLVMGVIGISALIASAVLLVVDLVMYLVGIVLTVLIIIGAAILMTIQGAIQIVIWAVMSIITILWFIWSVFETICLLIDAAFRSLIVGVVGLFYGLAQTVLGILNLIAKGIDAIFGSELSLTVSKWQGSLEGKFTSFVQEQGPGTSMEKIGETWTEFGTGVADMFTSDFNLYDEIGNVGKGTGDLINGMWGLVDKGDEAIGNGLAAVDGWAYGSANSVFNWGLGSDNSLAGALVDPGKVYDSGYDLGSGLVNAIGDISLGSGEYLFDTTITTPEVEVAGGHLDSIDSDVDISDEDVQLLRDMAARDFLLQLQSITPVANVSFGDVRETADVNKIVEVIEQMVEEQMATALVS